MVEYKSQSTQQHIEDDLKNESGQIVVSSRMVAERFGKEHKNVLRSIEETIEGVAQNCANLFILTQYQHPQQKPLFTVEQVDILQQIIKEYQTRQQIQSVADQNKGKTINRNVRVYEKQFEAFANWCKVNNVTQADALYKAIDLIMNGKD